MSGKRSEWVDVALDDELKATLAIDATLAMERRGSRWQAVRRHEGMEHLLVATLSLAGVALLGWPAQPMLVFLVLSVWAGVAFDVARWLASPGAVEDCLHYDMRDGRFWSAVDAWRAGATSFRDRPETGNESSPLMHLLVAVMLAIGFSVALTIDLVRAADVNLALMFASRPDMVALMLLSLGIQYGVRIADFRRRPRTPEEIVSMNFNPMGEAALFMLMLVLWMTFGTVYLQLAGLFGLDDSRDALVTLFVIAAYLIMFWRGVGELREVGRVRDRIDWLERTLRERPATH